MEASSDTGISTQPTSSPNDVSVDMKDMECIESNCQETHPNVRAYLADIRSTEQQERIGFVKVFTLNKAGMDCISPRQMYEEGHIYDDMHSGAQIHKVENFLENEDFYSERDAQVAQAEMFIFVEEVLLEKRFRGTRGRGLAAVREALLRLGPPAKSVVLLQAGSTDESEYDTFQTDDKLTRYWGNMGFGVWSDSDPAWLCLSLEDEVHGLAALQGQMSRKLHT